MNINFSYSKYKSILLGGFILLFVSYGCSLLLTGDNSKNQYDWITDKSVFVGVGYYLPKPQFFDTYALYLNGIEQESSTILLVDNPGYHELVEEMRIGNTYTSNKYRFVILDEDRKSTEWGLFPWTPPPFSENTVTLPLTSTLIVIYPQSYPENLLFPCIVLLEDEGGPSFFNKFCTMPVPLPPIPVKRGFGSIVSKVYPTGTMLAFSIDSITMDLPFNIESNVMWTTKGGSISGSELWGANSRIHITNDIIIDEGNSLTIEQGSIIIIDKNINFYISGNLSINGLANNVIVFTSFDQTELWGGMNVSGNNAELLAFNSIFMKSGGNEDMGHGHSETQPLFMAENNAALICSGVYIIDNGGQAFGGDASAVTIKNSLIQNCVTGGQFTNCKLTIEESCFTDLPEESPDYLNNDNDGIYISGNDTTALITGSRFMYTKDDGIDSGGSRGGDITITNCIIDSCFHEGLALSSGGLQEKIHTIVNTYITRCGQGIELGYSSRYHQVFVNHCLLYENQIGIRYGDNYSLDYNGTMLIQNSISINNYKDIWNMITTCWEPSPDGILFFNSFFYICQELYGTQENRILSFNTTMDVLPTSPGYKEGTDGENIGLIE